MNKDKKMLYGIGIVFLFLATVGFSYAYFTATIVNKDVKEQVVQTGTLELTYTDGPEIIMNNIKPGATITKEISVKNTGTLNTSYNLVWQELANEIINDEMVIEATCTRYNGDTVEGTCESLTSTPIKRIKIKENVSIEPNIIHKYNITITFKETNADQNYNQGKSFTATLGINEYVENTPIYCTFDGEMVQGTEYVNGQYTYKYKQEYAPNYDATSDDDMIILQNIDNGWSVFLTDKESTNPVTSKLCTYINNEPVTSMSLMFYQSKAKVLDLSSFDTSNVTNMSYMFGGSNATTLDLSNFDTSKVTDMSRMFSGSNATTLDVSNFDTSKVTDMSGMFNESKTTFLDLSNFDTSKVSNMTWMFARNKAKKLDLSSFDTSNVTNMSYMFGGSNATTLDLSNFDTSNVTTMVEMFNNSQAVEIKGLEKFNTSKVINMASMFGNYCHAKSLDVSSFDTSNVTDMGYMFESSYATEIKGLENFNTSKVTNMEYMFYRSHVYEIDVSNFDTSKVTDMKFMFSYSSNLKHIYVSDKFVTTNVTDDYYMFENSPNLVGGAGTKYNSSFVDKTYARIDGGTSSPGYFTLKNN